MYTYLYIHTCICICICTCICMTRMCFRTLEEDLVQCNGRVGQIDAGPARACLCGAVAQKATTTAPEPRAAQQLHTGTELRYHRVQYHLSPGVPNSTLAALDFVYRSWVEGGAPWPCWR